MNFISFLDLYRFCLIFGVISASENAQQQLGLRRTPVLLDSQMALCKIKIVNRAIHVVEPIISALVQLGLESVRRDGRIYVVVSSAFD